MPNVRLPNGKIVRNVPEGTSREDLARKLRDNNVISQEEFQAMAPRAAIDEGLSAGERFMIGTGRGAMDVAEGAKQLGLEVGDFLGMVDPSKVKKFTQNAEQERQLYNKGDLGVMGTAGRVTGNIAATAVPGGAVMKGLSAIPKLGAAGRAIMAARGAKIAIAAGAGGAGGAMTFVPEGGSRLQNAALGSLVGMVGQKAVNALSRQIQKIPRGLSRLASANRRRKVAIESLRGKVPDNELQGIADDVADGLTPDQALRKADIERIGGIPTRGRVSGEPGDLAAEVRLGRAQENASGDVVALQEAQQANKRTILQNADQMVKRYASPDQAAPGVAGRRAASALSEAKDQTQKNVVTPAYNQAGEKLAQFGDDVSIQANQVANSVADEIDNLNDPGMAPVRGVLREFGILSKTDEGFAVNPQAQLNAKQAESLRRRLSKINGPNPGRVASKVQRALEADVKDTFGEDIFGAARRTAKDEFFDKYVNPARVNAVIQGDVAPEKITSQMKNWSADETSKFFQVLDEANPQVGQAMRASFMDDLMSRLRGHSLDVEGLPEITAATFSRGLNQVGDDKLNAVFGEGAAKAIKRFANSVKALTSVDRRAAGPNTANDLINKIQGAGFAMQTKFPILGSLLISASRAIGNANIDKQTQRQARRALNINLLKNEQVMQDILGQQVSVGGTMAAGQQGAQTGEDAKQAGQRLLRGMTAFGESPRPTP